MVPIQGGHLFIGMILSVESELATESAIEVLRAANGMRNEPFRILDSISHEFSDYPEAVEAHDEQRKARLVAR